jgi:squalene-hopene/tetraprenyl-beta-curcumene cyclase
VPFYTESDGPGKLSQSRGTESILNALILVSADAPNGKLREDTRAAFEHMWTAQEKTGDQKGAWQWLNFGNEPFEANESGFYGASLAAVAVGTAPEDYRATPEIQNNINLLGDYIHREIGHQSLVDQVVTLWASTKWPGLLASTQKKSIIDKALAAQQSDGGWGLSSAGWTWMGLPMRSLLNLWVRSNDIPLAGKSDGYATGLMVYVLGQAGVSREDLHLQRGRSWLDDRSVES